MPFHVLATPKGPPTHVLLIFLRVHALFPFAPNFIPSSIKVINSNFNRKN